MFQDRTLLERLGSAHGTARRTATEDIGALQRSITRHLARMLNCRQGHAAAQMDYGLPDATEIAQRMPDAITEMERAIRECIEKYEPRLRNIQVSPIEDEDDPLSLRFQITGQLAMSKDRSAVSFDTLVDSTGHIRIHD